MSKQSDAFAQSLRPTGCIFAISGFILVIVFVVVLVNSNKTDFEVLLLVLYFPIIFCFYLIKLGCGFTQPLADEVLKKDSRAPILYLRQFKDDKDLIRYPAGKMRTFDKLSIPTWQDEIAQTLSKLGPFIALGDPKKHLPDSGPARKFCSDKEWKKIVRGYLRHAQLVIYRIGESDALEWELKEAIKLVSPMRLLIFIPPPTFTPTSFLKLPFEKFFRDRDYKKVERQYSLFREKLGRHIPSELPEKCERTIFIWFDKKWKPHLVGDIEAQHNKSGPKVVQKALNSILINIGLVNH